MDNYQKVNIVVKNNDYDGREAVFRFSLTPTSVVRLLDEASNITLSQDKKEGK